jgi:hypothetical protein
MTSLSSTVPRILRLLRTTAGCQTWNPKSILVGEVGLAALLAIFTDLMGKESVRRRWEASDQ